MKKKLYSVAVWKISQLKPAENERVSFPLLFQDSTFVSDRILSKSELAEYDLVAASQWSECAPENNAILSCIESLSDSDSSGRIPV